MGSPEHPFNVNLREAAALVPGSIWHGDPFINHLFSIRDAGNHVEALPSRFPSLFGGQGHSQPEANGLRMTGMFNSMF